MAAYEELLAQQLAEEMQQSSLGNLLSAGLASFGLTGSSSGNSSSSSSSGRNGGAAPLPARGMQQNSSQPQPPPTRATTGAASPSGSRHSNSSGSGGFSMARASAFFASAQEEAKRKMNEVAVKFQAATGNGGYATQVPKLDSANNWYFARNGRCATVC
jgi:hypothetical protein